MRTINISCFLLLAIFILNSCTSSDNQETESQELSYLQIQGNAQGTTFNIIYSDSEERDFTTDINNILEEYNLALSSYVDESVLSLINTSLDHSFQLQEKGSKYFTECYEISKNIFYRTNGLFNPAIYPIVDYWGFYDDKMNNSPSINEIDSILTFSHFEEKYFSLSNGILTKQNKLSKLDFNAIAQGHSVDVLANYLDAKGVQNYMIEIGGEVHTKGTNPDGNLWTIGVDQPIENSTPGEHDFQFIAGLEDMSLATSGNYRKFYELDGKKYSHTINPVTGYPVQHNLLSVTVIAKNCADADAYATSFMVMGILNSLEFINNNPDLELFGYFVFDVNGETKTAMSKGFEKFIVQ